ncbi:hypothetical protein DL769_010864 [Monosporascus sp. CRB-8-3]|nr:hypothetical protein DL769_010864 [Monosporascus sp. CRB-8-3]
MSIDPSQSSVIPVTGKKLRNRDTWPDWYTQLRYHARFRGIWRYIDPNAADAPHLGSAAPPATPAAPATTSAASATTSAASAATSAEPAASSSSGEATQGEPQGLKEWAILSSRYTSLWNWINATVDSEILSSCLRELDLLHPDDDPSIQRIVRLLKERLAPTDESTANTVRLQYIAVLDLAKVGHLKPEEWYAKWHDAYVRARAHNIPEIQGRLAVQQFLLAIAQRMDPTWAQRELEELARAEALETPITPLESYGKWYSTLIHQREQLEGRRNAIFATLAEGSEGYHCPCLATSTRKHRWTPDKCHKLLMALGKALPPGVTRPAIADSQLERIKKRAQLDEWKAVREQMEELPDAPSESTYGNITA